VNIGHGTKVMRKGEGEMGRGRDGVRERKGEWEKGEGESEGERG